MRMGPPKIVFVALQGEGVESEAARLALSHRAMPSAMLQCLKQALPRCQPDAGTMLLDPAVSQPCSG